MSQPCPLQCLVVFITNRDSLGGHYKRVHPTFAYITTVAMQREFEKDLQVYGLRNATNRGDDDEAADAGVDDVTASDAASSAASSSSTESALNSGRISKRAVYRDAWQLKEWKVASPTDVIEPPPQCAPQNVMFGMRQQVSDATSVPLMPSCNRFMVAAQRQRSKNTCRVDNTTPPTSSLRRLRYVMPAPGETIDSSPAPTARKHSSPPGRSPLITKTITLSSGLRLIDRRKKTPSVDCTGFRMTYKFLPYLLFYIWVCVRVCLVR